MTFARVDYKIFFCFYRWHFLNLHEALVEVDHFQIYQLGFRVECCIVVGLRTPKTFQKFGLTHLDTDYMCSTFDALQQSEFSWDITIGVCQQKVSEAKTTVSYEWSSKIEVNCYCLIKTNKLDQLAVFKLMKRWQQRFS